MNGAGRLDLATKHTLERGERIRRRHVIYVEGYDPGGPDWYFDLFRRSCERFQRLRPVSIALKPLKFDSDDFARWDMEARGPNWRVGVRYDFLRLERFIETDMARSTEPFVLLCFGWFFGDLLGGTTLRILRAAWRFGLHLLYFQFLLLIWVGFAAAIAVVVAGMLAAKFGVPCTGMIVAPIVFFSVLLGLRPLAERLGVIQIGNCWLVLRRFARGRSTWLDQAIEAGARRVVDAARANEADEIVLIGHSSGCVVAAAVAARALEIEPRIGREGPRLVLLTLGSVMPAVALHPAAERMRRIVRTLATAPALDWIDCQSRKDVMCFANFDPVAGIGLEVGAQRRNPLLWRIRFRDMIAPERYGRFRWNYLRVHYQYIMAGDRPAPYDYMLLVCSPIAVAEWPNRGERAADTLVDGVAADDAQPGRAMTVGAAP